MTTLSPEMQDVSEELSAMIEQLSKEAQRNAQGLADHFARAAADLAANKDARNVPDNVERYKALVHKINTLQKLKSRLRL